MKIFSNRFLQKIVTTFADGKPSQNAVAMGSIELWGLEDPI